jgi:hypothetical protein
VSERCQQTSRNKMSSPDLKDVGKGGRGGGQFPPSAPMKPLAAQQQQLQLMGPAVMYHTHAQPSGYYYQHLQQQQRPVVAGAEVGGEMLSGNRAGPVSYERAGMTGVHAFAQPHAAHYGYPLTDNLYHAVMASRNDGAYPPQPTSSGLLPGMRRSGDRKEHGAALRDRSLPSSEDASYQNSMSMGAGVGKMGNLRNVGPMLPMSDPRVTLSDIGGLYSASRFSVDPYSRAPTSYGHVKEENSTASSAAEEYPKSGSTLFSRRKNACDFCSRSKKKCNGSMPCSNCKKRGQTCSFSRRKKRESKASASVLPPRKMHKEGHPLPLEPGESGGCEDDELIRDNALVCMCLQALGCAFAGMVDHDSLRMGMVAVALNPHSRSSGNEMRMPTASHIALYTSVLLVGAILNESSPEALAVYWLRATSALRRTEGLEPSLATVRSHFLMALARMMDGDMTQFVTHVQRGEQIMDALTSSSLGPDIKAVRLFWANMVLNPLDEPFRCEEELNSYKLSPLLYSSDHIPEYMLLEVFTGLEIMYSRAYLHEKKEGVRGARFRVDEGPLFDFMSSPITAILVEASAKTVEISLTATSPGSNLAIVSWIIIQRIFVGNIDEASYFAKRVAEMVLGLPSILRWPPMLHYTHIVACLLGFVGEDEIYSQLQSIHNSVPCSFPTGYLLPKSVEALEPECVCDILACQDLLWRIRNYVNMWKRGQDAVNVDLDLGDGAARNTDTSLVGCKEGAEDACSRENGAKMMDVPDDGDNNSSNDAASAPSSGLKDSSDPAVCSGGSSSSDQMGEMETTVKDVEMEEEKSSAGGNDADEDRETAQ